MATKKELLNQIKILKQENERLFNALQADIIALGDSTQIFEDEIPIYIVWTIGQYPSGVRLLDIRAVTTTLAKAKLYSKMLRRDKQPEELWERVVIEPRVANHLYAEKFREILVNTGQM